MKLLLHICCGPCSLYPISELLKEEFEEVAGFFYNPNIHPYSEYLRRRQALEETLEIFREIFRPGLGETRSENTRPGHSNAGSEDSLKIFFPEYDIKDFFKTIIGEYSKPVRCELCWALRLKRTAEFAKISGFDAFSTTLLISPYQDHDSLKDIGKKIETELGLKFYYRDFRIGFRESQNKAKEKQLYRQKYCGCVFSEMERAEVT